eukprot:COSAG06_NODE_817_length_12118_cov_6.463683_6_plen_57_part_00
MLRLAMTLPLAMAMPAVDHRAERQAMVRPLLFLSARTPSFKVITSFGARGGLPALA